MNYRWDWAILLQEPYFDWLVSGIRWTILLSLVSWAIALVLGIAIGVARTMPNRLLRSAARIYVEIFRNIPLIAQLFLWFFVVPELLPEEIGLWVKRDMPEPQFTTAAIGIGLSVAARIAEQVRAGVRAVGARMMSPALATGLRPMQAYRLVILPLGLRSIIGPLTSEALVTMKMSSVALTIGVLEITAESRHVENYTFHGFEAFAVATLTYLLLGLVITALMGWLRHRLTPSGIAAR